MELSVQFFKDVYSATEKWPSGTGQLFSLVMDIRRLAMGIPNDITEGLNRHGDQDSLEFLENSQEALAILQKDLVAVRDYKELVKEDLNPLLTKIDTIISKINSLKSSYIAAK